MSSSASGCDRTVSRSWSGSRRGPGTLKHTGSGGLRPDLTRCRPAAIDLSNSPATNGERGPERRTLGGHWTGMGKLMRLEEIALESDNLTVKLFAVTAWGARHCLSEAV